MKILTLTGNFEELDNIVNAIPDDYKLVHIDYENRTSILEVHDTYSDEDLLKFTSDSSVSSVHVLDVDRMVIAALYLYRNVENNLISYDGWLLNGQEIESEIV